MRSFYSLDKHFQNQTAAAINSLLGGHHLVMDVSLKAVMRNFQISRSNMDNLESDQATGTKNSCNIYTDVFVRLCAVGQKHIKLRLK